MASPPKKPSGKYDDEGAACDFLMGRLQRPKIKYLRGAEEERARAAFVRVLRDVDRPLHFSLRLNLASLFDSHSRSERLLIFKKRREGNWQEDRHGNHVVFWYVEELRKRGAPLKAAVEDAAKDFRLSTSQIRRKYNAHVASSR
jgi:hypothetical protein